MKNKTYSILSALLFGLMMMNGPAPVALNAQTNQASWNREFHPQTVNYLLRETAEYLDVSLGRARQYYNDGRITFQVMATYPDHATVMIAFDGVCIIIADIIEI